MIFKLRSAVTELVDDGDVSGARLVAVTVPEGPVEVSHFSEEANTIVGSIVLPTGTDRS